jgi:hypothetical protein
MTKAEVEDRGVIARPSMKRFAIGFLIVTSLWCSRAGMQNPLDISASKLAPPT